MAGERKGHRPSVGHRLRLKPDDVNAMVAAYAAGVPVNDLAQQVNVHRSTVLSQLSKDGGDRRVRRCDESILSEATVLYQEGRTVAEVASQLGVNRETLRLHLRRSGVVLRKRGSSPGGSDGT